MNDRECWGDLRDGKKMFIQCRKKKATKKENKWRKIHICTLELNAKALFVIVEMKKGNKNKMCYDEMCFHSGGWRWMDGKCVL